MKKIFSFISLWVLLVSTFSPYITYAHTEVEEESKIILKEKLEETYQQIIKIKQYKR